MKLKEKLVKLANFKRIPNTRFDYSMLVLMAAAYISENIDGLHEYLVETEKLIPNIESVNNSIKMLKLLNLIQEKDRNLKITAKGQNVLNLVKAKSKNLTQDGLQNALQKAMDSLPFIKKWTEIICDEKAYNHSCNISHSRSITNMDDYIFN